MWKSCPKCGGIHLQGERCPLAKRGTDKTKTADNKEFVFRSSQAWKDMREVIKERDGYCCAYCRYTHDKINKDKFVTEGLSVHHIVPLKEGFDKRLDSENLITLCARCHARAEKGEISKDELKKIVEKISPRGDKIKG